MLLTKKHVVQSPGNQSKEKSTAAWSMAPGQVHIYLGERSQKKMVLEDEGIEVSVSVGTTSPWTCPCKSPIFWGVPSGKVQWIWVWGCFLWGSFRVVIELIELLDSKLNRFTGSSQICSSNVRSTHADGFWSTLRLESLFRTSTWPERGEVDRCSVDAK